MLLSIQPGGNLKGEIVVPGDKSISHRAIMIGALANGVSEIQHFLTGEDTLATLDAFKLLGVKIEGPANENVRVYGVGLQGLKAPEKIIDCKNSGTCLRLLTGILAAQSFNSEITGDESLKKRPMNRIIQPLIEMGAKIISQPNNTAPLKITGGQTLKGICYKMPIASAQVKSCLLLAGLYAEGATTMTEPAMSRNHTERMLRAFGYEVKRKGSVVSLEGKGELTATKIIIPGDISSAAFFVVGATISPGSDIILKRVGVNPTRIGVINILRMMGATIQIENETEIAGEAVADVHVTSSHLRGIDIPMDQVPLAIDEFPVIFIAAACAKGVTTLRNAKELRVKESDRIAVMAEGLQQLGIETEVMDDGIRIEGGQLQGGHVDSYGDHRIAMAFSIAGLQANQKIIVENAENVVTSFPNFVTLAQQAGLNIEET